MRGTQAMKLTPRLFRAARPLDFLERSTVVTLGQRFTRAALWLCLGVAIAVAAITYQERNFPAPATVLPPVIEHTGGLFSVYRLRFDVRGGELACRLVIYRGDHPTWSVQC